MPVPVPMPVPMPPPDDYAGGDEGVGAAGEGDGKGEGEGCPALLRRGDDGDDVWEAEAEDENGIDYGDRYQAFDERSDGFVGVESPQSGG